MGKLSKRCEVGGEHEPTRPDNIIDALGGNIYCAKCGMVGHVSRGRRKYGRPPRIFWNAEAPRYDVGQASIPDIQIKGAA